MATQSRQYMKDQSWWLHCNVQSKELALPGHLLHSKDVILVGVPMSVRMAKYMFTNLEELQEHRP